MVDVRGNAAAALTHAEITKGVSAAPGRPVAFVNASEDDMLHALAEMKKPDWQVEDVIDNYAHYCRGEKAEIATGCATRRQQLARPSVATVMLAGWIPAGVHGSWIAHAGPGLAD